jgi:Asp-tRNA(Asn)/Glu-tRNA(Gln) amidotransferase A subunit family amidase
MSALPIHARTLAGLAKGLKQRGIPYAHKDIFCTDGVRTSCGSRMLDNFIAPTTPPSWRGSPRRAR